MKVPTWLPIFPGFYNTLFEASSDDECEEFSCHGIAEKDYDLCYETKSYERAWRKYEKDVCERAVSIIEIFLTPLYIEKLEFEKIMSPKEYNFGNDAINIEASLSAYNIETIINYISDNMEAWTWYLLRYKSYDGFASSYDYHPDDEDWADVEEALEDEHKCGAILQFICLNNGMDEGVLYSLMETRYTVSDTIVKEVRLLKREQREKKRVEKLTMERNVFNLEVINMVGERKPVSKELVALIQRHDGIHGYASTLTQVVSRHKGKIKKKGKWKYFTGRTSFKEYEDKNEVYIEVKDCLWLNFTKIKVKED